MIDMVTLVVSSDFGRNANFAGAQFGTGGDGTLGNGHYYLNNNYIFCGKNINNVWLGASDPITRYPYVADFAQLNNGISGDAAFHDPIDPVSKTPQSQTLQIKQGFVAPQLQDEVSGAPVYAPRYVRAKTLQRALMAKDVVRTIMAIAGLDSEFNASYENAFYRDAQLIAPLVKR